MATVNFQAPQEFQAFSAQSHQWWGWGCRGNLTQLPQEVAIVLQGLWQRPRMLQPCLWAMTTVLTLLVPFWAALSTCCGARKLCEDPLHWIVSCRGHRPIIGSGYRYLSPSSSHDVSSFLNCNRCQFQGWNRHCYSGTRMQAMQEFPFRQVSTSLHYIIVAFPFSSSYFSFPITAPS